MQVFYIRCKKTGEFWANGRVSSRIPALYISEVAANRQLHQIRLHKVGGMYLNYKFEVREGYFDLLENV